MNFAWKVYLTFVYLPQFILSFEFLAIQQTIDGHLNSATSLRCSQSLSTSARNFVMQVCGIGINRD